MPTHLREVLVAIAATKPALDSGDAAVALIKKQLDAVEACREDGPVPQLIEVRNAARLALQQLGPLASNPAVKSYVTLLEPKLEALERLIKREESDSVADRYQLAKQPLAAGIALYDGLLRAGGLRGAAQEALAEFVELYTTGRTAMIGGEKDGDLVRSLDRGIPPVQRALNVVLPAAREAYTQKYTPVQVAMAAVCQGLDGGQPFENVAGATADAARRALAGLKSPAQLTIDGDFAAAYAALATARQAMEAVRTAAANQLMATYAGGSKAQRSAARRQADAMIAADPDALRQMLKAPGGKDALDAMVAEVGSSASSDADKAFVAGAVKARFNVDEFTGDLTTKALPRMYQLLAQMPEAHTVNNPKLAAIERKQENGTSTYGDGKLTLCVPKTGRLHHNVRNFDPDEEVPKEWKVSSKNVSDFDQVTLHELGHSVDDKLGFMDGRAQAANLGGWKRHPAAEVADLAGNERGFYRDFTAFPQAMLRKALITALGGAFPPRSFWETEKALADAAPDRNALLTNKLVLAAETERATLGRGWNAVVAGPKHASLTMNTGAPEFAPHAGVIKRVLDAILQQNKPAVRAVDEVLGELNAVGDAPADDVWQRMVDHPAVDWCIKVGRKDVWGLGRKGATENADAAGIAVYLRGTGGFFSYLMSARGKCVSSYQFNSPAEWFAELYAAYYMGKLPESHPDHDWMTREIHQAA